MSRNICIQDYGFGPFLQPFRWICIEGLTQSEIHAEVARVFPRRPVSVVDSEGFGPDCDFESVSGYAGREALIQEIEEKNLCLPAFWAYLGHEGAEYATLENFQEHYVGEFDSVECFGEEMAEVFGYWDQVPEHLHPFFNSKEFGEYCLMTSHFCVDGEYYFRRSGC